MDIDMVLKSFDPPWNSTRGSHHKHPQDEFFNKDEKRELMYLIKAGHDRWKMSHHWKAEEKAIRKYEEELIKHCGSYLKEINEQRLAELESQLDEISKCANEIRFRSMLENVYNLDAPSLKYLFNEENEIYHKKLKLTDEILKREWKRFLESQRINASIAKALKNNDVSGGDHKKSNALEKEYKKRITRFVEKVLKKMHIGKLECQLLSKRLCAEDKEDRTLVEKVSERSIRSKENLARIISIAQKGLDDLRRKKRQRNKKDAKRKYTGYIDEECEICQKHEEVWEEERLKTNKYSEAMTSEDAKEFHTRFLRSGGMRGLVEQFKNLLDEDPPKNLVLPKFMLQVAHPEATVGLNEELVNYNRLKFLQDGLEKIDKEVDKKKKRLLFDKNTDFQTKCTLCGMK